MTRRWLEDGSKMTRAWVRYAVMVVMMLVVGVNTAWSAKIDYWFFIVNKSGKIVTYAKANLEQNNNANGNQIPAAIKSVNATNWRLYNGDQLASNLENITLPSGLPQVTKPNASYVVDCSTWGTVTLVDNPTTMSNLSNCENATRYPNCIFVFYDYDENSVPDLRYGTYTMQFRGGYKENNNTYDPINSFLYYNTSSNRMASTANYSGSHPVTNPVTIEEAENDSKYLWYFKATEVGGVVDPYDVKIYNAYVGIGENDYFVANPLDAGTNGAGSGPENENNKLQPKSILNSDKIASYYIASSSYSGQYNITGKPAYNEGSGNDDIRKTVYYNLWAEYQHDGNTTANISKGGITNQSNFQRSKGRQNFASIILTRVTYTYNIVDASGNTILQATTDDNTLDVPDVIKSPLAYYTYYGTQQDAIDKTNALSGTKAGATTTIYVRYTTINDILNLKGEIKYNISVGGTNYLYAADATTLSSETTSENNGINTHKWTLNGDDAYQITIKNVDNSKEITYDVSSGEAVPTLSGAGSKFFLHQSTIGQYEVVAITANDYSTPNYYTLGLDAGYLKLYSSSSHAFGDTKVQTVFTPRATAAITTPPTANSLTYNGSNQNLVTSGTASNGTIKYRIGDTGSYETSIPEAKDANTYSVYYMAAGADGYEDFVASDPVEVTINKQSITVSGITASNKVYDGNTTATLVCTSATLTGNFDSEYLTVSGTGTFGNKNVGTNKTVAISGLTLGGSAAGNYVIAASGNQTSTTANISAKDITASGTITASNKVYDGNTTAVFNYSGVTLTGKVDGDDLSVTATGTFEDKDVGTGKTITVSNVALSGNDVGNYNLASSSISTTTTANITTREITVNGITASNKVYNGNTTATLVYTGATLTGMVANDDLSVTATGTFANKNVGTGKTVTISGLTLSGNDATNYALAATGNQTTTTANITAKSVTVKSGITASNKTYDGTTTATLNGSAAVIEGIIEGDDLTVTTIIGAFDTKDAGTGKTITINSFTFAGADAGNYEMAASGHQSSITANITPAPLTATSNDITVSYGDAIPTYTATYSGFVNGETDPGFTTNPTFSCDYAPTSSVSSSPFIITVSGGVAQNYAINSYNTGTLTVNRASVTVTADNLEKTYNDTDPTLTATVSGLKNGDAASVISYTLSRADGENAGNYTITATGDAEQGNYMVTYNNGTLTINPIGVTLTSNNGTETYDGSNKTVSGYTCSVDGLTFANVTASRTAKDAGTYDVTFTGLTVNDTKDATGNYMVTEAITGTLTIHPKTLTITPTSGLSKSYSSSDPELTYTYSGLVEGDNITFNGVLGRAEGEDAGNYEINIGTLASANSNYALVITEGVYFSIIKSIGDGSIASGFTVEIGEGGAIILKDGEIMLTQNTDYTLGDPTGSGKYSSRTVTGAGNYTGNFNIREAIVTFQTDVNGMEWSATFVAEKSGQTDIGHALPDGIKAYIITSIEGGWAIPEELDYIPEGVPVLLVSNNEIGGFQVENANSDDVHLITSAQKTANMLEVVNNELDGFVDDNTSENDQEAHFNTKTIYLLYKNEFIYNMEGYLAKGKVYLNPIHPTDPSSATAVPSPAPMRMRINWDVVNVIKEIPDKGNTEKWNSGQWYGIDGRPLNGTPTRKGLYFHNGKKVIIKEDL